MYQQFVLSAEYYSMAWRHPSLFLNSPVFFRNEVFNILFIYGCVGSQLRPVVARGLLSSCGTRAAEHTGSVVCDTQAL